ncbi:hypothetical protein BGW38_006933, partial [Lunasporangiospora selenospora]
YQAKSNESKFTYDGIDICAHRLVKEVHEVVKVIEDGGDIHDLKGHKHKAQVKKVTQFSYLGYSLGGLIGRFAMGLLDMEGFFDRIEPMYFVTMATPHLGIRQPPKSRLSRVFNYLSSRMLSRTGEQLQFVDDYIQGKPLMLVMSEPESIFVKALGRFKRRAAYCNIRNDRSVPFWTASFSDADPFSEFESMDVQYNEVYSSIIESFGPQDLDKLAQREREQEESLKATTFTERASHRLQSVPWRRYAIMGVLVPVLLPFWIVFAATTISYQGVDSRMRTKGVAETEEDLKRIREKVSTVNLASYNDEDEGNDSDTEVRPRVLTSEITEDRSTPSRASSDHTTIEVEESREEGEEATVSYSYPHLKKVRQLPLLPVQIEVSRNLNRLEWSKHIIHIDSMNAHASIVVRAKRFAHDGGVATVQHAVDMFKDDGEDE